MTNGEEHTEMTDLDWLIVGELAKQIIGPRHEVEKPASKPTEKKKATALTVASKTKKIKS